MYSHQTCQVLNVTRDPERRFTCNLYLFLLIGIPTYNKAKHKGPVQLKGNSEILE